MSKKTIIFLAITAVLVIGGTIAFFKWIKPAMDKKREEKRKLETKVIQNAQSTPTTDTQVKEMVKETLSYRPGFGDSAK